jgi:hypothetical protein
VRRSPDRDRDDLAVDRPDRPALRPPARDAICAASTAQLFIPPLAGPTTTGYVTGLVGEEPVANAQHGTGRRSLAPAREQAAPAPWQRQVPRGHAILIYRDLPPAVVRGPAWGVNRGV